MSTAIDRASISTGSQTPAPTGDRFVAGALWILAALLVTVQGLARELIPPLAIFAVVFLGVGVVVARRRSRWLLVGVIVLSLVYLVGSTPFFIANLAHPESPASFLAEAFVGLALLTALIGAVAGLRGAQPGSRRPIAVGAGGLAAVAVVVSIVASSGVEADLRQPGDVAVEAVRSTYPAALELQAGESVLWVDNQDPFHHTLVIEGTDVRETLPGSTAVRMTVDLTPGTFRYFCDVPGHESMEGQIVVR